MDAVTVMPVLPNSFTSFYTLVFGKMGVEIE
jgi:hypothetical protein